jgi:hypothetical protein
MITTRKDLLKLHKTTTDECFRIIEVKNRDYGANSDALHNFRFVEQMGIPMAHGILTRLGDKLARIAKIVTTSETAVKDETVDDTIEDAINYLIILRAALNEQKVSDVGISDRTHRG